MNFTRTPFLLYSYLATEMLAPFFACFLIMNGVFVLVKLIPFLNFALDLGIGLADFIRLFSYMMPSMLLYTTPMASMMGIIICFSRLSNETEILALKASGVSIYRLLPPVLAITGIIALSTCYISTQLITKSDEAMKQLTYQLLKKKVDKGIKEYQFTEALGDLVIHVGQIDHDTGEWKDVWVSDMRDLDIPAITMASSGRMVSNIEEMNVSVLLRDGSLHRPDESDAQIVQFKQYIINIPLHLPNRVRAKERNILNMEQLLETSQRYGLDTERGRILLVEFHKRLVLPAGCLILSILALPLGLLAGPGKKTIGVPIGLGVFIVYYVLYATSKSMSEDGVASPSILMWLPNGLFLIIAIYSLARVAHELPILPFQLQLLFSRIYSISLKPLVSLIVALFVLIRELFHGKTEYESEKTAPVGTCLPIKADGQKKLFHLESCEHYTDECCTITFESVETAKECGFRPCADCQTRIDTNQSYQQTTDTLQK